MYLDELKKLKLKYDDYYHSIHAYGELLDGIEEFTEVDYVTAVAELVFAAAQKTAEAGQNGLTTGKTQKPR